MKLSEKIEQLQSLSDSVYQLSPDTIAKLKELEEKAGAFDVTLDYVKRRKVCGAMRSMDMTIRANVLTDVETFMKNSLDEVKDET